MHKYIVLGPPGAGKTTQSAKLCQYLNAVHISVGEILRWNVANRTKLGAQIKETTDAGRLVTDDIIEELVRARLERHDWNYGFVLDGYPRNENQAQFYLCSYDVDAVICLKVPDEMVIERLLNMRHCAHCNVDYNLVTAPPKLGETCDVCGETLVTRRSSTPEVVEVRLNEHHSKIDPVIDVFNRRELVAGVDARGSKEDVFEGILEKVQVPSGLQLNAKT